MCKNIKNGFTLAETIMTLVVIALVVGASIPVFTQRHNSINQENGTPWKYCDTNNRKGLCTANPIVLRSDAALNNTPYTYSETNIAGGVGSVNYNLSVHDSNTNIFDIVQSDKRWIKIGNRNFILSQNNLIMSNLDLANAIANNGNNNILIGDSSITGSNNVVIGNTQVNGSSNIAIGNNAGGNNGNGSILFGTGITNTGANSIVIGNHINNQVPNAIVIGSGTTAPAAAPVGAPIINDLPNVTDILNIGGVIRADNAGNIHFSNDVAQLNFAGRFITSNPGTFNSDIRLKNIKGKYQKGLAEIKKVEPVIYTYKSDTSKFPNTGVIAQDIQKIFPEAVVELPNGYLGLTTDPIFFGMFNALKEVDTKATLEEQKRQKLQKELNDLTQEIETLTACKADNNVWDKIRCFFFDVKLFFKDVFGKFFAFAELDNNAIANETKQPVLSGENGIEKPSTIGRGQKINMRKQHFYANIRFSGEGTTQTNSDVIAVILNFNNQPLTRFCKPHPSATKSVSPVGRDALRLRDTEEAEVKYEKV